MAGVCILFLTLHRLVLIGVPVLGWVSTTRRGYSASSPKGFRVGLLMLWLEWVVSSIWNCFSASLTIVLVAELMVSRQGLGYVISEAWGLVDVKMMLCVIVLVGALALISNVILRRLESTLNSYLNKKAIESFLGGFH